MLIEDAGRAARLFGTATAWPMGGDGGAWRVRLALERNRERLTLELAILGEKS